MKKIALSMLTLFSVTAIAQKEIKVQQDTVAMSKGTQPSFQVVIPEIKLTEVEKDWTKYTGSGSKGKATSVNGENVQPGAVNKNISPNPFNVYSKLLETTEGVKLTVWLTENDTIFMAKEVNSDQNLAAEKYVRDFAVQEYQSVVKKELKSEQEKQEELESALKDLIKQQEKNGKKISENQRSIQRANDDIATNNADIQTKAYQINDSKRMVDRTASDENANKGAKKTLKDLENAKKKLQKDNESNSKNIDNLNKDIRELEREIANLKQQQETKISEIEKQKLRVAEVQNKLDNIK